MSRQDDGGFGGVGAAWRACRTEVSEGGPLPCDSQLLPSPRSVSYMQERRRGHVPGPKSPYPMHGLAWTACELGNRATRCPFSPLAIRKSGVKVKPEGQKPVAGQAADMKRFRRKKQEENDR